MTLWIPGGDPILDMRAQIDAERRAYAEERLEHLRHFNQELRAIDPYLELVKVREDAPDDDVAVRPGFWHVVRHNPGAPDTWMPVTDDDGNYVEPTSRIFDRLAQGDMWRDEFGQRQHKRAAERTAQAEREKEINRERRADEIRERHLAATRTQVSMNRDTAWAQNARGAALMRGEKRRRKTGS